MTCSLLRGPSRLEMCTNSHEPRRASGERHDAAQQRNALQDAEAVEHRKIRHPGTSPTAERRPMIASWPLS
jgi:hypothetical protein